MGFRYQKSISLGPFRINVSNSGVGYSVGARGFRTGVSPRGRRYTIFSVPGTGASYRTSSQPSQAGGCFGVLVALLTLGAVLLAGLT
jgi:hypothetical protein